MGVPICSYNKQYQVEDNKSSCFYCCQKTGQIDDANNTILNKINNINDNIDDNSNRLNLNYRIIENNEEKANFKNQRNYENNNSFFLDRNALCSTFSFNQNKSNDMTKEDNYINSVVRIQNYFRKYLNKKEKEKIVNLDNIKSSSRKDSNQNKLNLKLNVVFNESSFSNDVLNYNDNIDKSSLVILTNNLLNSSIENIQFPFNIRNKRKNLYYKYSGYTKQQLALDNNNKVEIVKEGFGKIFFSDGTELSGIFHNNIIQGYGRYTNINQKQNIDEGEKGKEKEKVIIITETDNQYYEDFIGEYKDYIPNGFGIYRNYLTNLQLTGIFMNNKFSDIGIEESGEGGYIYNGEFLNNKKEGNGIMVWKDGQKYWGEFKNNQMNGYGIIEYPGKIFYQGEVRNGRMEGFGEFFWKRNKKYIGYYKNDQRNGFGIYIFKGEEFLKNPLKSETISEISCINGLSAYIGFWKDGNMDGFGMKINSKEIKYGIWENGIKKKWFENRNGVKQYFKYNGKNYKKFFLGSENKIFNFLDLCINIDKDIFPYD